jgi:hypothetical protein
VISSYHFHYLTSSSKKIAAAFKKAPAKLKPKKSTRQKSTTGATQPSGDVMKTLDELKTLMKTIVDSTTQPQIKIILPVQTVVLSPTTESANTQTQDNNTQDMNKKQHVSDK